MAAKKIREILGNEGLPPNPTIDIQNDEHRGIGGSYLLDPEIGKRTRVAGPDLDQKPTNQAESTESVQSLEAEALSNESQ